MVGVSFVKHKYATTLKFITGKRPEHRPEHHCEMVPLQLAQFQLMLFIAEISQLEVHQALIEVSQSFCADSERIR